MSEWKEYKLGDFGFFNNGVNKSKGSFGHGSPFVNLLDIFDKDRIDYIPTGLVDVSKDELNRYNLIDGDILFVRSSVKLDGVGKVCVVTKDLKDTIYSGFIIRYRQSKIVLDKLFASFYLNYFAIRQQIISKGTFSANSNINQESLKNIQICVPLLSIQRRIASILSITNLVIEKTQAAIAKYKAIKQGMLHDLFTRGIDINTGRLRPKYEDAPELYKESKLGWVPREWEVIKIEDFASEEKNAIVDGPFGSNLKTIHYRQSGVPIIQSGFVTSNSFIAKTYLYVDYDKFQSEIRSKTSPGDIIMAKIGAQCGTCAILPMNHPIGILAGNCLKITVDKKNSRNFLVSYLHFLYETGRINSIISTTAQPAVSMSSLKVMTIKYPKPIEQKEIAQRLEVINSKILSEQNYLQKMQSIKQGLMGDLLSGRKSVIADADVKKDISEIVILK